MKNENEPKIELNDIDVDGIIKAFEMEYADFEPVKPKTSNNESKIKAESNDEFDLNDEPSVNDPYENFIENQIKGKNDSNNIPDEKRVYRVLCK